MASLAQKRITAIWHIVRSPNRKELEIPFYREANQARKGASTKKSSSLCFQFDRLLWPEILRRRFASARNVALKKYRQ
jgi:hypothetical protein